ncbi:MAG: hypothetical protein KIT63_24005 [Rhodoferax sp.]|nr:hypothetical protein [Rhodoferax sp.]
MTYLLLAILAAVLLALAALVVWMIGRLVGGLAGFVARQSPNRARTVASARKMTYAGTSAFLLYIAYGAVYPSDDFFLGEYKEVTLREVPNTARVVAKSASYPDLHGDYCSFSRIQLGAPAYELVLRDLSTDTRLSPGEGLGSQEEQAVQRQVPRIGVRKSFTRAVPGEADRFLAIRFLDDGAHVEVSVCYT